MKTAEWLCEACGTTNRRLVDDGVSEVDDRCVACRARHHVVEGPRPVRWTATRTAS